VQDLANSPASDAELDVWQAAGCTVRIDYSRALLEELRLASVDGFNRLAHGGLEIGGVLFGVHDAGAVKVLEHRALACEYGFGPSFTLSENDRRALENLLSSPATDAELSGMQPVGWYHSHTRSEILLSEKDLELFDRYFPDRWQIALVLRPHRFDPVRAGFFFREPDGSVHSASSRHEFVIPYRGGKPVQPLSVDGVPADSAPAVALQPAPHVPSPQPHAVSPAHLQLSPSPRAASARTRRRRAWSAAAIAVVACAAVLFWIGGSSASPGLALRAVDVGGQLRIDWNHNARVVQQSASGALEIEDGLVKVHDELSPEHLRAGNITYLRTTGTVMVRLLVRDANRRTLTEMTRFLGPPVAAAGVSDNGPAARSAKPDAIDPAPVPRASEPEADRRESVAAARSPSHRTREEGSPGQSGRQAPAASAPPRRALTISPAAVSRAAEPLFPAPPVIAANVAAPVATFIPRLPVLLPPKPGERGPTAGVDSSPPAGTVIWTGRLLRSGTVKILGSRASQGQITGGFPGAPIRVRVFPTELTQEGLRIFTADPGSVTAPEAPGAQNGWNRTVYVLNPRKAGEIRILENPGEQNDWNRLTLHAERGDHSVIFIRWQRVPQEPARRAVDDQ
jgi:hypothetical protein